jgi:hypothetical protein
MPARVHAWRISSGWKWADERTRPEARRSDEGEAAGDTARPKINMNQLLWRGFWESARNAAGEGIRRETWQILTAAPRVRFNRPGGGFGRAILSGASGRGPRRPA